KKGSLNKVFKDLILTCVATADRRGVRASSSIASSSFRGQESAPPPPASSSTAFPVSLSSSLRQSDSSSRAPAPGGSRVRIGDQGHLVAQGGGSFFNYLPQDEAVAADSFGSCELRGLYVGCGRSSRRDPGARAADSLSQKDHEGGLLLLFFYANMLFISFFLKKEHRINDCPHGLFTFHFPLRFWISIQILCVEVFVYIVVGVCAKHTYFVVC
ncbi:hypothetical protein IGI04_000120, partial [Brassica rapa subsp. trilocularis]